MHTKIIDNTPSRICDFRTKQSPPSKSAKFAKFVVRSFSAVCHLRPLQSRFPPLRLLSHGLTVEPSPSSRSVSVASPLRFNRAAPRYPSPFRCHFRSIPVQKHGAFSAGRYGKIHQKKVRIVDESPSAVSLMKKKFHFISLFQMFC
ncbi:hypothetical protein HMPREF0645_1391 [Hallella bergensis DSM 17361]|uniref:Uncharacterized protein n=1 Tax=Hallella bergensis DSM 17361 TaxID=585502 RepID=D1PWQ6_9BACT|nr:hypothetical protein HMPREF0645_1391 [Hallella bergensis DSM 17361]